MQERRKSIVDAVEGRLENAEAAGDEDRSTTLEEIHNDLESALAEVEGVQTGSPGH
jgi:hypothetical protein